MSNVLARCLQNVIIPRFYILNNNRIKLSIFQAEEKQDQLLFLLQGALSSLTGSTSTSKMTKLIQPTIGDRLGSASAAMNFTIQALT
jgi:hypothetical protein